VMQSNYKRPEESAGTHARQTEETRPHASDAKSDHSTERPAN
jgi:hypothetical protein